MSGPSLLENPIPFEPFLYKGLEEILLPKVEKGSTSLEFISVFANRRSIKKLGACSLTSLSNVLYFAVKPYCIGQDDYGVTVYRSAAPSAGGRHPIDILVGLKEGVTRRLYLYQPLRHSLRRLAIPDEEQRCFYSDIEVTLPLGESTLLWFSVQYLRTASKYSDYSSLIWRDIGAQLCCLQQAAKYVGIDSCPIGYLAEKTFHEMFQTSKLLSGGGMIMGPAI